MRDKSIGERLSLAMQRVPLSSAELARAAGTTEATVSNWINDKVHVDHVKALQLFKIADAAKMNPRELLLGEKAARVAESQAYYQSHPLQHDLLIIALQQVSEVVDVNNLPMPPAKRAELTLSVYELLADGVPEAKVLRFVRAAAA